MSNDPNDFLTGGGVTSAKFPTIGTLVKGTVLGFEMAQQTDLEGVLKTYADGNPMMQVVVTLQTDERDPAVDDDDGKRKLYVKGQMRVAVGDALKKAGAKMENGGTLAVKFDSEKAPEKRGHNPAKQYVAQYLAPAQGAANDLLAAPAAAAEQDLVGASNGVAADDLLG